MYFSGFFFKITIKDTKGTKMADPIYESSLKAGLSTSYSVIIKYGCCGYFKVSKVVWCKCFWTFKLSFDVDILAVFGLATVLATF